MPESDGFDWERALARAYRAAYGVLHDAPLAQEVAQQACFKALAKLESFQSRGSFPGWVQSIAFRLALDLKKNPGPAGPDPDELPGPGDPERGAIARQASNALFHCLAELTERQRLIFLAKYLHQMKGSEIAAEMNTREGTVWATLNQTAANLRRCLDRHGFDRETIH